MIHDLKKLDPSHPFRTTPMREIEGLECRNILQKRWRPVKNWVIGRSSFNALSGTWIENNEWRIKDARDL